MVDAKWVVDSLRGGASFPIDSKYTVKIKPLSALTAGELLELKIFWTLLIKAILCGVPLSGA